MKINHTFLGIIPTDTVYKHLKTHSDSDIFTDVVAVKRGRVTVELRKEFLDD